jgi:hypothetical protein
MGMSHMQWFQIRPPHGWQRQVAEYEDSRDTIIICIILSKTFKRLHQKHILRDRWPSTAACPACKGIEIVYGEEKYFALGLLEQPKQNKDLLHRHDKSSEPTKEGTLSFVLFESLLI